MANIGLSLNRGLIRNFNYLNLPTNNAQVTPATNGIISVQNNLPNIVQTFGANNIAKIQNMKTEDTYHNSDLNTVTVAGNVTLNTENLSTTQTLSTLGTITSTSDNLNILGLTNFVTLTSL
jgi:hypothetical protein